MNETRLLKEFRLKGIRHPMGADDPARIEELEKAAGWPLPEDYREFLLKYAPSSFSRYVVFGPLLEPSPSTRSGALAVGVFLGLDEGDSYDIILNYEITRDHYPEGLIPIGEDGGSSKVLLALDEPAGRVYYQDRQDGNVYLCANSFTEFIERSRIDYDNEDSEEYDEEEEQEEEP